MNPKIQTDLTDCILSGVNNIATSVDSKEAGVHPPSGVAQARHRDPPRQVTY